MEKLILVLIYLFLQWLYLPLSRRPVKYYWRLQLDDKIPLLPGMIVFYFSYFLMFFPGSLTLIFSGQFRPFIIVMIMARALTFSTPLLLAIFWPGCGRSGGC